MSASDQEVETNDDDGKGTALNQTKDSSTTEDLPETVVLEQTKSQGEQANGLDAKPTKYAWTVLFTIFAVRAIHQLNRQIIGYAYGY